MNRPAVMKMLGDRGAVLTARGDEITERVLVGEGSSARVELAMLVDEMEFILRLARELNLQAELAVEVRRWQELERRCRELLD